MYPVGSPNWSPKEECKSSPSTFKRKLSLNSLEWVFTPDDIKLYERIAETLQDCFQRLEIPEKPSLYDKAKGCHIIFRQSTSWETVAAKIDDLVTSAPGKMKKNDMDVLKWGTTWKLHIRTLKNLESQRLKAATFLRDNKHNHDACLTEMQRMTQASVSISTKLHELSNELVGKYDTLKSHSACKSVIDYIQSSWHHLTVFADWHEVRMDDDKIHARIIPYTDTNDNDSSSVSSTAFFNVQPVSQTEILAEYPGKKPDKAIIATKLVIITKKLAPPSPCPKKSNLPTSPQSLPKALISSNNTVKIYKLDALAQNSFTALKLEILVNLALKTVNQVLDPSSSADDHLQYSPNNKPSTFLFKLLPH